MQRAKAPGQRPPDGPGAGLCPSRTCQSAGHCRARAGENAARVSCCCPKVRQHHNRINGRGHRPCHSATTGSGPAGGQSPRPAPAPPPAGAGLCPSRTCRSTGHRRARAGETRVAFPVPAHNDDSTITASLAGAIAPATASRRDQDRPGAKAPGQRPPRPWRALRPRRVGRWPLSVQDLPVCRAPLRAGGGNALRFLIPPERATASSPHQWQGPSPLPQRPAGP